MDVIRVPKLITSVLKNATWFAIKDLDTLSSSSPGEAALLCLSHVVWTPVDGRSSKQMVQLRVRMELLHLKYCFSSAITLLFCGRTGTQPEYSVLCCRTERLLTMGTL